MNIGKHISNRRRVNKIVLPSQRVGHIDNRKIKQSIVFLKAFEPAVSSVTVSSSVVQSTNCLPRLWSKSRISRLHGNVVEQCCYIIVCVERSRSARALLWPTTTSQTDANHHKKNAVYDGHRAAVGTEEGKLKQSAGVVVVLRSRAVCKRKNVTRRQRKRAKQTLRIGVGVGETKTIFGTKKKRR